MYTTEDDDAEAEIAELERQLSEDIGIFDIGWEVELRRLFNG